MKAQGGSSQCHAPAEYPLKWPGIPYRGGWVGPGSGLDGWGKSHPPPAFDPRTVKPEASRSIGYAIPDHENAKAILITDVPTANDTCADTLFLPHLHRRRYVLQTKAATRFRVYENNNEYTDNKQYLRRCERNIPPIWFFDFFSVSA